MNRLLAAACILTVTTSVTCATFDFQSPESNYEINYNANVSAGGHCGNPESGTLSLVYNNNVVWQSTSVNGSMMWTATLNVPVNPGYWHNLNILAACELHLDPSGGGSIVKRAVKVKDNPNLN